MKQFLLMVIMAVLFLMTMRTFCSERPDLGFSPVSMRSMYQQIAHTERELDGMLGQLKQNTYLSEMSMQKLINLIDLESDIVNLLIKHRTGYVIQKAVNSRKKVIRRTLPSVVRAYDVVLDLATMYAELENELRSYYARHKNDLTYALRADDKEQFLYHMLNTLEYYYQVIERMQYASRVIN